jgi:hypothetical protein
MPGTIRVALVAAIALLGCAASFAHADDAADIRASGKAFSQAMNKGDVAEARNHAITDEKTKKFLGVLVEISSATHKLTEAAVAKFGDEGKGIAPQGRMGNNAQEIAKKMDEARIEVNGDTATVQAPDEKQGQQNQPVKFKKSGGAWKLDFTNIPHEDQLARGLPFMSKMATVMNETTADIKDGKYKTVEEAKAALHQKLAAALGFGARPGRPAGPPPNQGNEK